MNFKRKEKEKDRVLHFTNGKDYVMTKSKIKSFFKSLFS